MNEVDLIKKIRDPKYYLETFCKIKTKEKGAGLQPFILNEAQKDIFNTLRGPDRNIIIRKVRQLGFSTAITGFFYVDTIMNPGTNTGIVGYNVDVCAELLEKINIFYQTTPAELRPTIKYNSKYEMSFPKINSKIVILPSTENVGRGFTLHNCLLTELPMWDGQDKKFTALNESVPPSGKLVIESTPKNVGDVYHRLWTGDNDFVKKDYGWWWGYTKEAMEKKKREIGLDAWRSEYGLEFLASGRPVFEMEMTRRQRKNILNVGDKNGNFTVVSDDGWIIYREPEVGGIYALGSDVAEGVRGGDYSVIIIWDRRTGEEVAMFRGQVHPEKLANLINVYGRRYNNALAVVEVNNHGLTTLTVLKQLCYPSLYFRPSKFESISTGYTDRLGWRTTVSTRAFLIDEFHSALRNGDLTIHSKYLLDEMMTFVYDDNGNMVCLNGYHDDCIFAGAIGFQGFKTLFNGELTQIDERAHLPRGYAY